MKRYVAFLFTTVEISYVFSISQLLLQVEYKLGFQVDNPMAMAMPQANISLQGEVPRTLSGKIPIPQKCTATANIDNAFWWYFVCSKMCVTLCKTIVFLH